MKRTYIFIITAIIAAMGALVACHENIIDETLTDDINQAKVEINIDPNNPLVAKVSDLNDNTFYIYGTKNDEGNPVTMESLVLEGADGNGCDFIFNENEMPTAITTTDGVKFYLEWQTSTYAALTAIDPNTGFQLNTYLDLNSDLQNTLTKSKSVNVTQKRTKGLYLEVKPILPNTEKKNSLVNTRASISSGTIPMTLHLKNCESYVDATCFVEVLGLDGKTLTRCKGIKETTGLYTVHIPKSFYQETVNTHKIAEGCNKVADMMGKVCFLNGGVNLMQKLAICTQIAFAITSSTAGAAVEAALIFEGACASASALLELYCNTLGAGPQDPSAPTIANGMCQLIENYADKYASRVTLLPYVYAIPNNIYGQPIDVDLATGYIPDCNISWGGSANISSFKLIPSAPNAGVDYVAVAELRCLPEDTFIQMSIVGTDGYSDSVYYTVVSDQQNYTAELHVPGAAEGVRDECNITITLPDGTTLTKDASLIFH